MQSLKAHVQNGRFVLEDPTTDLAEGSQVELVVVDDEMSADERTQLLAAIEEGFADAERGAWVDGMEFAKELRARREAPSR